MAENGQRGLALMEFSDRELMNLMIDYQDDSGWVEVQQFALAVGLGDDPHASRCVAQRFVWMRRYGVMERHKTDAKWRLTPAGRKIALGALSESEKATLRNLTSEQLMEATTVLTGRYKRAGNTPSTMMRRAWQHGTGRR